MLNSFRLNSGKFFAVDAGVDLMSAGDLITQMPTPKIQTPLQSYSVPLSPVISLQEPIISSNRVMAPGTTSILNSGLPQEQITPTPNALIATTDPLSGKPNIAPVKSNTKKYIIISLIAITAIGIGYKVINKKAA